MVMLTDSEQRFLADWEIKRQQKRGGFNFGLGMRLGIFMFVAVIINLVTGWHKRAAMAFNGSSSTLLVIIVAGVAIVVFMSMFSQRYQWEQKEQRYQELAAKRKALEEKKENI